MSEKQDEELSLASLAQGAAWKAAGVESIRKWLAENIKDIAVIA